jgi:uncharacterized protein (DUF885 family)
MLRRIVSVFCLSATLSLSLAAQSTPAASAKTDTSGDAKLNAVLDAEWQYELSANPESATFVGDTRYNDRLDDYSPASYAKATEHAKAVLRDVEAVNPGTLSDEGRLNRTLIVRNLLRSIEDAPFKNWEMPVDQMNGPHLDYASMASQMPFETVKDYQNYLARLHLLPAAFDQITENMRLGLHDNLMPPKYLLEKVVTEVKDIADRPVDKSPFAAPIEKFPAGIPKPMQQQLARLIRMAISKEVNPAYVKFGAFVRDEYTPHGRTDFGIWALPNGAARYLAAVREMTTTNLKPEEIHAMGLKQVADLDAEMLVVAKSQGFEDVKSFNEHIRNDHKLYGTSPEQMLGLYQHYTDQMYNKLPQLFSHLPVNKLEVVPMDAFRAPDAVPADYSPGAPNRPGRINVNEYDPEHRLLLNVEAIAYHEGIPGHHMQFSIAQELKDVPLFRKFGDYNAYSEGWALYAERLGKEVGFYQDPYSEYGRLGNEMWRSIRLVVDTGVHHDHWTRDQMIQFFREHTAMDEKNIESEVDRYIAWPGQALAYKMGQMKILEMRELAKKELGTKFDIRTFNDAVLSEGALPLDVLDTRMRLWIKSQK